MNERPRLFYGWLIVAVSGVGLFLGPPIVVFSFSVFLKPLVEDFHAGRAAVSFAFSLANTMGALSIPCVGMAIDRFGAKRLVVVSTVVYGLVLCAALWVGSSLWQLYLFYALLNIGMTAGAAPVPYGVVISHWFNRYRGLALGLAMMGIGVGSVVVPLVAQRLIAAFGWRSAFAIFGGVVLLVPLPVLTLGLQNDPAERGLRPDGRERETVSSLPPEVKTGMSWGEIWRSPRFWLLLCIFSLAGASVHGVALHMAAIFTDRGASTAQAATATSLVGAAVLVGRLCSGYLLDQMFAPRVAILFYSATALGIAILCTGVSGSMAFVAAFLAGLGMGAEVESMAYMVSRYFGLAAFGASYGVAFGAFMISGSAGALLMGAGYDRFHSYTFPLASFCVAMVLTTILLTRLGQYRYPVDAEPNAAMEPIQVPSSA
jgi:MFS family permease